MAEAPNSPNFSGSKAVVVPTGPDGAVNSATNPLFVAVTGSGVTATQVEGTAAGNAPAVGNPVQTGGIYELTPSTYDNGDAVPLHTDVNGNLKTTSVSIGVISAANSSAVTLGGGAVFTGTSVSTLPYGSIFVSVISDVASATNGLSLQQSSNGTNWDITDTYTVAAGAAKAVIAPRQAAFFRVVYTNGAGAQASFRLQTILNGQMPTAASVKIADGLTTENDAEETIAAIGLFDGTSTLNLLRGSATGGAFMQGNIASGVADSGNPVKMGGVNNTTAPTLTNGQRGDVQLGVRGSQFVYIKSDGNNNAADVSSSGADGSSVGNMLNVYSAGRLWNSATYDRAPGNTTGAFVAGAIAAGAADSGNPVKVGGKYNATAPTLVDGNRGDIQLGSRGALNVQLTSANAAGIINNTTMNVDGISAVANAIDVMAIPVLINGAGTLDRQRGNVETGALITLAAAAPATTNSADTVNYNGRGVMVTIDITAIATQTVTVNIQLKDPTSGKYVTLLASTALAAVATTVMTVYPGCIAVANSVANLPMPRTWRVQTVGAVGGTVSLTVAASIIL